MASARLQPDSYDFEDPVDASRCQTTIRDFMSLVERNSLRSDKGKDLMTQFCGFVYNRKVWGLAQMVVPQFRMSAAGKFVQ